MTRQHSQATRLLTAGRQKTGWVNTPVTRASTYLFDSVEHWRSTRQRREEERLVSYGARGTDSTHALEDALIELEGGHRAQLFPTGHAAIAITLTALLKPGDHVLITDAVYEPVRRFCTDHLQRMGVDYEFYPPDGTGLEQRMRSSTRLIYAECPGSLTYDMMDLPAVAALAKKHDCLLAVDSTWGSGVLYHPLDLGADISILAATKYLGGHSDVMMGAVVCNSTAWPAIQSASIGFGQTVGADDAWLVLRGIRSLHARMAMHQNGVEAVIPWLQSRPEVARVISPALPEHPGHLLWKRDCKGTNGLFSVEFEETFSPDSVESMMDALELFGIGASWGGFESLILPVNLKDARALTAYPYKGSVVRLHIGLEDPADLIADLEHAFRYLKADRQVSVSY